jgi:hypothetical protein
MLKKSTAMVRGLLLLLMILHSANSYCKTGKWKEMVKGEDDKMKEVCHGNQFFRMLRL